MHTPLPRIYQIVDSTSTIKLLSYLDAYSGYHQINIRVEDEEHIVFVTPFGTYCYIKMLFGLTNVGATYQKCVHTVFSEQIGRNLEAYIDNIIVKSKQLVDLLPDLRETFDNL